MRGLGDTKGDTWVNQLGPATPASAWLGSGTRQYLDDAEELLESETTAVAFFNAKIERYPDHVGRTVLWVGTQVLYAARERPEEDIRRVTLASWL